MSTARGQLWLVAAVACFALSTPQSQALEIGRAAVNSSIGEPLDAYVRIRLNPGEHIDNSCLSAGSQADFPESDHILISNVQLSLFTSKNAIRISTSRPVDLPAVSMALRVRCAGGPLTVRALNLYLNPGSTPVTTPVTRNIASRLPGTSITVRPGDTVYGFARTIFEGNEKAVRDLALAIAIANPSLFPDGKPRPLRVGERVTIPDLRTVQRIVAESGITPDSVFPPSPKSTASGKSGSRSRKSKSASRSNNSAGNSAGAGKQPQSVRIERVVRTASGIQIQTPSMRRIGPLRLMLALNIDLTPSKGMTEAARAVLRQELWPGGGMNSGLPSPAGNDALSMRVARVGEAQAGINAQIRLLSSKVAALQESVAGQDRISRPLPDATAQVPESNSAPPSVVAYNSIAPSAAASNSVLPPKTASKAAEPGILSSAAEAAKTTAKITMSLWNQSSSWKWPTVAVATLLLLALAIKYRPRRLIQTPNTNDGERISNILEQVRTAAIPVLGEESIPPVDDVYQSTPDNKGKNFYDEAARTVIDPSARHADAHAPSSSAIRPLYPDIIDPSTRGVYNQGLKREMADALDSARSMFSDVDRFIVLGRAENAISMLEFQIETHPEDRDAWVKLMAIYEQEGMTEEFERTYTAFGEKFANG